MVARDASSIKRLAYVTRRVRVLQELQRFGVIDCLNVPGRSNPADAMTKYLDKRTFRTYMARIYNNKHFLI